MTTKLLPVSVLILLSILFVGCQNNESARIREAARESLPVIDPNTIVAPSSSTASVNSSVPHYQCPNNCVGGVSSTSGSCPVCGTDMVHNQAYHNPTPNPTVTPTSAATSSTAQNTGGVFHYICSNGCAGGAASATACATCGNTLVHNQAYHSQAATTPAAPTLSSPVFNQATTSPASSTSAAQNAAGVYHYTCSNGCSGGAGSAIACATCGNTLVHNQAYHN
ncbi:MAG: heavy metal-binding domain-containing protein [Saprospiraceae bacterium]|nr:hypothetical protein [Lewinella sp.]